MTPEQFVESIETDNATALSRLGSSKGLYADTGGTMERAAVLRAAATGEFHARETFEKWADDETNDDAREAFAETAREEGEHYGLIAGELEGEHDPGETPAIQESLRTQSDTTGRAGAFLGRTMVADRSADQATAFFVGEADTEGADLLREVGDDTEAQLERAQDLLGEVCTEPADWERASAAASDAIGAAHEEYTDSLDEMGESPEPSS
ncbi:rubrerythrin family protein [Halobacteriales archaeon QH_8_64_26]|nr:MAG: rubrerythrin family protein [Halobacteriales archaeon QH_8_64_26]